VKTFNCRCTLLLGSLLLMAAGCNRPELGSSTQGLSDTDRQWAGKGFGFVWDEATPDTVGTDSPVRFSGVAYSCTLGDFYANTALSGPISASDKINVIGSANMDTSEAVPLSGGKPWILYYEVSVPMTGSVNSPNGVCDAEVNARLVAKVDLQEMTASFTEATAVDGEMVCTHKNGMTIKISIPTMALPLLDKIRINVLETEACLKDLGSKP
jgi:hypothetical protein